MQSQDSAYDFSIGDDHDSPLTIYPEVAVAGNRQLVEDVIADLEGFETASSATPLTEANFDIAVFDTEGLESSLDNALARKREAEPELVPYLLLLPESSDDTITVGTDADQSQEISAVIDAIISMPTTKTEFAWQLRNLARQRRQSQQLAKRERQVRSKYQNLVNTAPDAIIVADADTGKIIETNPATEALVGYTRDELQGRDILTLHPEDEGEKYQQLFTSHVFEAEGGSATRSHLSDGSRIHVTTKDGTKIPVEINARVTEFEDQTLITGIFRDISNRVERIENLESFKEAAETTDVAIFWTDRDGVIQYANPAFEDQTGYAVKEAVGQKLSTLKSGSQSNAFYDDMWETLMDGETWQGEIVNERKNGDRYAVEQRVSPIVGENGHIERFVSVAVDVTDRKRRENKLHRRSRALESAPVGILITDPDQDDNPLIYVNDAVEDITGHSREELVGENARILQGENTDPEKVAEFRNAVENGESVSLELRNYRKDGTEFWNKMAIAPVRDDDGTVMNWVGFQQDVTERKQRMTQLNVMNRLLRHNMRNDLNVIQGRAKLLADNLPAKNQDSVEAIVKNSEELADLAEKGRVITTLLQDRPKREEIDVETRVRTVASDIQGDHPAADITVEAQGNTVRTPSTEIDKAIRELIENAIIHNDQETPTVAVEITGQDESVEVEVRDTGPTISDADRGSLLGEDPSQLQHGSGLGLWLINIAATRSGGSVSYEENSPRGNRIQLRLP
ncbi:PAS domain S-box protein [Halanaeroarchaeum sulfurireducens]|nr:PAS domain S-box protein [Halanaeroarchaeum sulfurireducens]